MTDKDSNSKNSYETKTRQEVVELYKNALDKHLVHKYEKSTKVLARQAKEGEEVITSIKGEERTKNRAKKGDFIVKNPSGEEYIVSADKFKKRYKLSGEAPKVPNYKEYQAVGTVWGFKYEGPPLKIEAPWGEQQLVRNGDLIVSLSKHEYDDIYSIHKDVFEDTYEKAENRRRN